MNITQSNAARHQMLSRAAARSSQLPPKTQTAKAQEKATSSITEKRAVRSEDVPKIPVQKDEVLPESVTVASMEGMVRYNYSPGTNGQRVNDSFQAEIDMIMAHSNMYDSLKGFKSEAKVMFPDLSTQDFGLSVDAGGELIILDKGDLTKEQHSQLTELLQNSSHYKTIKRHANKLVDAAISWNKINNGSETTPSLHFDKFNNQRDFNLDINKQNFHQIYDLYSDSSQLRQLYGNAPRTEHTYQVSTYTNGQWVDSWV